MIIENITSKGISLDRNGQSMQREVYEREIRQLQSNWNSLREWVQSAIYETLDKYEREALQDVLDKINELEGVNNE